MCWCTSSKNENVRSLFNLASGSSTAMDEPLQAVAFAPPPAPSPTAQAPLGRGRRNKGVLQAGVARLQNPTKKVPLPPASAGGRGQGIGGKIDSQSSTVARESSVFQSVAEQLPCEP